ncbi:MAG: pyrroline-5-carboxylate reductase [Clostridiales bacterium]|nr:pyrroline-5-carboxylate reductase [Clostridiales bacterium]
MSIFGFIGVGNMGSAILKSCSETFGKDKIVYYDLSSKNCEAISSKLNIEPEENNASVLKKSKYIILAVKPQVIKKVLYEIKPDIKPDHVIISLAVAVSIQSIKQILGHSTKVVRTMPNTPALISKGTTGVSFSSDEFTDDEKAIINRFLLSFSKYEVFDESLMNAVTCASGSSPAYVYMFIEALADSVVSLGIPRDKAYKLVANTVLGSAAMVLETQMHPGLLKDQVCSPGGTTIAAIKSLEEYGFRNALMKATDACYESANEISSANNN